MGNIDFFGASSKVETPFISVKIGEYTFGVHQSSKGKIEFPNYVQRLNVQKLNGTVNNYSLEIIYPITESSDPNFFEKVFSSVSRTRKIEFSYGDMSLPAFTYKEEEAIISKITPSFSIRSSTITYTITAQSTGIKARGATFYFPAMIKKPSEVIKTMLRSNQYGLTDIFSGMRTESAIQELIPINDKEVTLDSKNINVLDYLSYLVQCMIPTNNNGIYAMNIIDDTTGKYNGTYFKITNVLPNVKSSNEMYEIDIGTSTKDAIISFSLSDDTNYSILYDFAQEITNDEYIQEIDDNGKLVSVYAPLISSGNDTFVTQPYNESWWRKMTSFAIKGTLTLKGLYKPAILMQYIRINVYFYGTKHISSGIYLVTRQEDSIDSSGYRTTLSILRVGGDTI